MKDRIKKIRKDAGFTQREFAEKLGLKQNTVATYEMGRIGVSDAVIISICREFNINEDWLRYGTGPIHKILHGDEFTEVVARIDKNDPKARQAILDYWKLSKSDKELFWKFIDRFTRIDGAS